MNKNRKQRLLAALLLTVTAIIAALFSSCSGNNGQSAIIDPEVFRTGVGKNGRYLVSVSIKEPETPLTPYAGIPAYNEEYLAGHGIYDNDVRYNSGSYYRVIIYADREKLEELAKDPKTLLIVNYYDELSYEDVTWKYKIDYRVYKAGLELNERRFGESGQYLYFLEIKIKTSAGADDNAKKQCAENYLVRHNIEPKDINYCDHVNNVVRICADREKLEELAKDPATVWIRHDPTERETVWYCQSGENHVDA